jgi:bacillithiol biosynthesis cysteine-adding enzyme BshC
MTEFPDECQSIPASELPGTTLLYKTFLNDFPRVSRFYRHPAHPDGIRQAVAEAHIDDAVRGGVAEVLRVQNRAFGGDEATVRNLDRLRDGAVAVVTGQQVGLFGGPAYSIYKALTAIRIARDLTEQGTQAVPVFWLATEDHDLAEVNHTFFLKRGGLDRFDVPIEGAADRRVGEIQLGEAVRRLVSEATGVLDGISAEEVSGWLTESYTPEETFGTAFGKLMTRVFAGRGLILLDPLSVDLHRLAAKTMIGALREHKSLGEELIARSMDLEKSGYHAQVKVTEQSTLLFRIVDGQRVPLRSSQGGFAAGGLQQSTEETVKALEQHPGDFSPSALLRPVVQDTLLPTVAYIGGPAEIAYQAQTSLVYEKLLGRAPAILPRAGFTIVPAHVAHLLKKYNLGIQDVLAGRHRLHSKMEAEALPQAISARFDEGEKAIKDVLETLRGPVTRLDQTLSGALDTASEKMLYQFNSLRSKAGRAEGFRTGVLNTHETEIANSLLPNNSLQERSLSMLPFLAAEGRDLLDRLERHIRFGSGEHYVMYLQPALK